MTRCHSYSSYSSHYSYYYYYRRLWHRVTKCHSGLRQSIVFWVRTIIAVVVFSHRSAHHSALLTLVLLGLNESLCVHTPPTFWHAACVLRQVRHNGKAPEGQHGDDDA